MKTIETKPTRRVAREPGPYCLQGDDHYTLGRPIRPHYNFLFIGNPDGPEA